jgi:hypothetical protein
MILIKIILLNTIISISSHIGKYNHIMADNIYLFFEKKQMHL